MAVSAVSSATSTQAPLGLDFQSLLKIILTQLTYQDPLKPLDNFEFVSQLAQFAQLQQTQSLNDSLTNLLAAQSATEATSLLGRTVDISNSKDGSISASGTVTAVNFSSGTPQVTIKTADGQSIANLALSNITQVR